MGSSPAPPSRRPAPWWRPSSPSGMDAPRRRCSRRRAARRLHCAAASEGHDAVSPAQRIGPYEVLFELASGGMGTVYLARAMGAPVGADGFERLVAIKRMHLHLSSDDDCVRR